VPDPPLRGAPGIAFFVQRAHPSSGRTRAIALTLERSV